jgi:signal transduction histidine kinase
MRLPRLSEVGLVAVAFTVATAMGVGRPLIDLFFGGVVFSFLLLLGRLVWGSVVRSWRARRHERQIVAVGAGEVAVHAVEEERARLSSEIDRSVRQSLLTVRSLVNRADPAGDPRPTLVAIQTESRAAMAELRRQLGLIAADPATPEQERSDPWPDRVEDRTDQLGPLARGDLVLTIALLLLTTVEHVVFNVPGRSWWMTSAMALTVLTRRLAPIPTALAGAGVLVLGVVLDAAVGDGFSYPIVVGLLLWSVLERRLTLLSGATAAVLFACAVGSRYAHEPQNGPINIVLLMIVAAAALVVGRTRRSRALSQDRTGAHEARLAKARAQATEETRRAVARELHDVVSHAVSLVAVQAGAAELAWPQDAAATRSGLRAVGETVSAALAELDSQRWGDGPAPGWGDVIRTVDRLRDADLDVRLVTAGAPPDEVLPTVHRLVQEALTNVLKHAPGAIAYVLVSSDPDHTHVEVTNDGPGRTASVAGYGLVGLEDRVSAAGGTLRVGPGADGGFAVRAVLPHSRVAARPGR